jgi:hypothetical protein
LLAGWPSCKADPEAAEKLVATLGGGANTSGGREGLVTADANPTDVVDLACRVAGCVTAHFTLGMSSHGVSKLDYQSRSSYLCINGLL